MIKKLSINYESEFPCHFTHLIDYEGNKLLPETIEFKDGLNLVIGANGCGKTTLLNILSTLTLTESGVFKIPMDISLWDTLYNFVNEFGASKEYTLRDCFKFENDYSKPVIKFVRAGALRDDDMLASKEIFFNFFDSKSLSAGQCTINDLDLLFKRANDAIQNYNFNEEFESLGKSLTVNDTFKNGFKALDKALNSFNTKVETEQLVTAILDEPDASLDIDALADLRDVILHFSQCAQVIMVVHNPLLIKSLSEKANNIIELSPNYLEMILKF